MPLTPDSSRGPLRASPKFALRSYLYITLHYVFAKPLALLRVVVLGNTKLAVFFGVRGLFGLVSAVTEGYLVFSLAKTGRRTESRLLLCFLATSAAMFVSSTSFLPGTFSMYFFTLATAGVLQQNQTLVIVSCAVSVIVGWSVTAIAAIPHALWVLGTASFVRSLRTAVLLTASLLILTFAFDSYFYGRYVLSLHSFLSYNVFGSGDSALYGVEDSTFYLRNGLNNLNVLLPLSFAAPCFLLLRICLSSEKREQAKNLLAALSPQWFWLLAITMLPHKEERFMYVVYPEILLAAAYTVVQAGNSLAGVIGMFRGHVRKVFFTGALIITTMLSASRVGALLWNYDANMKIYMRLNQHLHTEGVGESCVVCVGSEWYEYPSSFFIPSGCGMEFVRSGFDGVLPAHYNASLGGTRYAAEYLNDMNEDDDRQFMENERACDFLISLKYDDKLLPKRQRIKGKTLEIVHELPYVQSSASKALYRALFIPFVSAHKLVYNSYALYKSKEG